MNEFKEYIETKIMELAAERNLDVCVSLFVGHLTGQHFRPGYEFNTDFFTDDSFLHKYILLDRLLVEGEVPPT